MFSGLIPSLSLTEKMVIIDFSYDKLKLIFATCLYFENINTSCLSLYLKC